MTTDVDTSAVTDEAMRELLATAQPYTAMLLRSTERMADEGAQAIVWEHGRRNIAMRAEGLMPVVCPATDESDWAGVAIFAAPVEEVDRIMSTDRGVEAGIFTYELHPVIGFPGSTLA